MKKILVMLAMLFMLVTSSAVLANPYQSHLNGDPNFPICDGHMGFARYVDLDSLEVNLYNPPVYIISANIVEVNADNNNEVTGSGTAQFKYNYDTQRMYIKTNNGWRFVPRDGSYVESSMQRAGEILFKTAYGMPFYH